MGVDANPKANARRLWIAAGVIFLLPLPTFSQTGEVAKHAGTSSSRPPLVS